MSFFFSIIFPSQIWLKKLFIFSLFTINLAFLLDEANPILIPEFLICFNNFTESLNLTNFFFLINFLKSIFFDLLICYMSFFFNSYLIFLKKNLIASFLAFPSIYK